MSDAWSARLSEYLDDELDSGERTTCEEHLQQCEACRRDLAALGAVRARAATLQDTEPGRDLWPDVQDRIRRVPVVPIDGRRPTTRRRLVSLSIPQLAAAGVALAMLGAGVMWLLPAPRGVIAGAAAPPGGFIAPAAVTSDEPEVSATIEDLQRVLQEHRNSLDTVTVRVLEENLLAIDQAIGEARAALLADPANRYLNAHLAQTLRLKVHLLRRATTLVRAAG